MPDKAFTSSVKWKMWKASLLLGAALYVLFLVYLYVYAGGFPNWIFFSAFAASAAILFGLSFAMSGFAYYFDFLDPYVAYRKYFGLVGFWFALVYSLSLMYLNPDKYFYDLFENLLTSDVLLGGIAMAIFTFMALISNNRAMKLLGVKRWRQSLRLGYVAYLLLVIRAYVTEKDIWSAWWQDPSQGLPPARIVLSAFALAVILFRLSMMVSKWSKSRRVPTTEPLQK